MPGTTAVPDSLNKPRIEQIQAASVMSAQNEFKAVDDEFAQIETLYGVGYRYRDR